MSTDTTQAVDAAAAALEPPLRLKVEPIPFRRHPMDDPDSEWNRTAAHFRCTLKRGTRHEFTLEYSKGSGHRVNGVTPPPTLAEIVECLDSDASCVDSTFEDFCADFGYDTDSRKAEALYRRCNEQAKRCLKVLSREELANLARIARGENE